MKLKEAKEIIEAGVAWANWTSEQQEAMKVAWNAMNKVERYEESLTVIRGLASFVMLSEAPQQIAKIEKYATEILKD